MELLLTKRGKTVGGANFGGGDGINFGNVRFKIPITLVHPSRDSKLYIIQEFSGKVWVADNIWELIANKWQVKPEDWMRLKRE